MYTHYIYMTLHVSSRQAFMTLLLEIDEIIVLFV